MRKERLDRNQLNRSVRKAEDELDGLRRAQEQAMKKFAYMTRSTMRERDGIYEQFSRKFKQSPGKDVLTGHEMEQSLRHWVASQQQMTEERCRGNRRKLESQREELLDKRKRLSWD
jgi:hypothetical protein